MKPGDINFIGLSTFIDLDNNETIKSFQINSLSGFDKNTSTYFTQFQLLPQETSNKLNIVRIYTNEINITINYTSSLNNIDICGIKIYGITTKCTIDKNSIIIQSKQNS